MDDAPLLRLSDRLLIDWVAQAAVGDPFPEPWCNAHNPPESMIRTLVGLGVMPRPAPGTDLATVARDATAAAKAWLEEHQPE